MLNEHAIDEKWLCYWYCKYANFDTVTSHRHHLAPIQTTTVMHKLNFLGCGYIHQVSTHNTSPPVHVKATTFVYSWCCVCRHVCIILRVLRSRATCVWCYKGVCTTQCWELLDKQSGLENQNCGLKNLWMAKLSLLCLPWSSDVCAT